VPGNVFCVVDYAGDPTQRPQRPNSDCGGLCEGPAAGTGERARNGAAASAQAAACSNGMQQLGVEGMAPQLACGRAARLSGWTWTAYMPNIMAVILDNVRCPCLADGIFAVLASADTSVDWLHLQ